MEVKAYKIPKSIDNSFEDVSNLFVCVENDYNEEVQKMVVGMVKAINLEMDKDIKILQIPKGEETIIFSPSSKLKKIMIFGLDPKRLGLNIVIKPYKIYNFETTSVVLCHKLEAIRNDKTKKMTLWKLLQHLYLNK